MRNSPRTPWAGAVHTHTHMHMHMHMHMPCTCRAHDVYMPCTCRAHAVHMHCMPCTCHARAMQMTCATHAAGSLCLLGLQPLPLKVAAPVTYGCSHPCCYLRLQRATLPHGPLARPILLPTVAAPVTYGCNPCYLRLQRATLPHGPLARRLARPHAVGRRPLACHTHGPRHRGGSRRLEP